jgi:tetratricopeptide (TPR) repeat protein
MRNLAIAYHQQNDYGKAVNVYRTLVRQANARPTAASAEDMAQLALLKQDYSKALLTLANKQYEANDLVGSGQLFEEAATQGDGSAPTQEAALLGLANVAFANGDKAKAVQIYHQVLALNPQQPVAGLAVAQLQVESGQNLPQAIAALQPLTHVPTVASDAWMAMGDAYDKQGQTTQAIAAYDQARVLNPKQLSAWMALGETYYGAKRLTEADQAFTQALTLDPGNVTALYNRASIALAAQQLPKAETDFLAALALKPDLADAQYGLAVVYDRQKLPLKAMTAYEAYLQAQPAGPYAPQVRSRLAVLKKPVATTANAVKPVAAKPSAVQPAALAIPVQPLDNNGPPTVDPFYDLRPVALPRLEP